MEHYIPKTDQPSPLNIEDLMPVALLNVEGRLFLSLISKHLEKHVIANKKFINTSVQMVWGAFKEAQGNKLNVANIWLDIANVSGSMPHSLIFSALEKYGVDKHWISLIKAYYSGIYSKSFSSSASSS